MCPTQKITTCSNYLFRPLAHPAPIQVHLRFRPLSVPVAGHDRTCGWMDPSCETTRSAPGRRGRTPAVRSSSSSSRPAAVGRAARAGARMNNSGWTRLEYWNKRSPSNGSTGTVRVGRLWPQRARGRAVASARPTRNGAARPDPSRARDRGARTALPRALRATVLRAMGCPRRRPTPTARARPRVSAGSDAASPVRDRRPTRRAAGPVAQDSDEALGRSACLRLPACLGSQACKAIIGGTEKGGEEEGAGQVQGGE